MRGQDSEGGYPDVMMQDHRSYWDDDGEEFTPPPNPSLNPLDEQTRGRIKAGVLGIASSR
jgi:hypothetical protein